MPVGVGRTCPIFFVPFFSPPPQTLPGSSLLARARSESPPDALHGRDPKVPTQIDRSPAPNYQGDPGPRPTSNFYLGVDKRAAKKAHGKYLDYEGEESESGPSTKPFREDGEVGHVCFRIVDSSRNDCLWSGSASTRCGRDLDDAVKSEAHQGNAAGYHA